MNRPGAEIDGARRAATDSLGVVAPKLVSTDGTRVVNYGQWDSAEAYRAMLADPTTQGHMAEAAALAISVDPHLYTAESVQEHGA